MVDTKRIEERRALRFSSMRDVLNDVEYLDSGDPPRSTGNWTPAQIVLHVAAVINYSVDGFPKPKAPLPVRLLVRPFRKRILANGLPAGVRFPKGFDFLAPPSNVDWEVAVDELRRAIGRLETDRMTQRSPVLGRLAHDQWVQLHCRHAELHFSFMHPA